MEASGAAQSPGRFDNINIEGGELGRRRPRRDARGQRRRWTEGNVIGLRTLRL